MEALEYSEEIDFQKYWLVLKRRWWAATGVLVMAVILSTLAVSRQKDSYKAEGKLLFKEDNSSSLTGLENEIGELKSLTNTSDPLATQAEIIRSRPLAQRTIETLELKDKEGNPLDPKNLWLGLEVKPINGTDVMGISYISDDPEKAAKVTNKIMEVYIENDIQTNRQKAAAARKFIDQQLPQVEANVSKSEAALRRFKEENRVVALEEEASASVSIISSLDNQIAQAQARLADVTARSTQLRSQLQLNSQQAVAVTSLSQSPAVQEALAQLQEVQAELAVEQTRYKEGYPTIENLKRKEAALQILVKKQVGQVLGGQQQVPTENLQIGELKESLAAALVDSEVERSGLSDHLQELQKSRTTYKTRSNSLPRLEQNQRELERKVEAAQSTYEILLSKLQETRVAENQTVGNASIISTAIVPEIPIGSKKKLIMVAGGMVGILLGVATAFLLDLIDSSVKTVKEAKELFGTTLLAVIPDYGKTNYILGEAEQNSSLIFARDLPRSPFNEAYQMLQANLKFLSSDKQIKSIVVTSSVPKEGKSEVCANLAAAMAQVGRRVLLVDGDMRHPSQHHIWSLTNAVGLSNVLVGEAQFKMAVQEVLPGLDVLPAGVIPPNPVGLLDSRRMASLIEAFSEEYDSVIIDTPALSGIPDAPIVGKMVDGILLVVQPRVLDIASANAAKEFMARANQNILGLVANGVVISNEPDSYFYYTKEQYKTKQQYREQDYVSNKPDVIENYSNN